MTPTTFRREDLGDGMGSSQSQPISDALRATTSGAEPSAALPSGPFACILADPPWAFEQWSGKKATPHRGAHDHYITTPTDQLCEIPVASVAAIEGLEGEARRCGLDGCANYVAAEARASSAEAALARLTEPVALAPTEVGWRGIESAPKDRAALFYHPPREHKRDPRLALPEVIRAGWMNDWPNRPPTHWMPLPPPPDNTPGVGGEGDRDAALANSAGALASERSPGAVPRKSDGGAR